MRWLVEVSRVSDGSSSERYCIDARRWQSALQEVRRLRGDEGPLPKLTIELLDTGYRAIDPELKVRYVVSEAPVDMPTSAGAQVRHTVEPPAGEAATTGVPAPAKAPAPSTGPAVDSIKATPSQAPAASQSVPAASPTPSDAPGGALTAQVIRQRDESPTAESPIHYRELALAVRPGAPKESVEALMRVRLEQVQASLNATDAQHYVQIAVFDHMFVKRPVRAPIATLAWKNWRGDPVLAFPGYAPKPAESSPSSGTPSTRPPSWKEDVAQPASLAPAPVVAIGSKAASAPPASAPSAGAPAAAGAAATVPRPGAAAPSSPPPAVPSSPPAAPSSPPAASRSSVVPAPVVSVGVRSSSRPAPALSGGPVVGPRSGDAEIPVPLVAKVQPGAGLETPREEELEIAVEMPPSAPVIDVAVESMPASDVPVSSAPVSPVAEALPLVKKSGSIPPPKPGSIPPPKPASVPPERRSPAPSRPGSIPGAGGAPRRRAPGEDLIGDLFERMHELAYMTDLVSGAEFVMHVLGELIPCEGILVHVFDLSRREFVVVRAHGPNARAALLHRTADGEPLVHGVMSRRSALVLDGAPTSIPPASASLTKLGIEPRAVMCGAARLGGRYLGLIELANPAGGQPFHDGEANALDYVCEQFAEFVASRPIVLDEDVVVGQ
jgi:hypothetical protein